MFQYKQRAARVAYWVGIQFFKLADRLEPPDFGIHQRDDLVEDGFEVVGERTTDPDGFAAVGEMTGDRSPVTTTPSPPPEPLEGSLEERKLKSWG